MAKNIIEVDTKTIIRFWLVLLGIALTILFLYQALTGLIIIGISIFLALALRPLVSSFNSFLSQHLGVKKNHQTISAIVAYSLIVACFTAIIIAVGPIFINETARFVQQLPKTFEQNIGGWHNLNNFGASIGIKNLEDEISKSLINFSEHILGNLPSAVLTSINTISDILMKIILVLVLTLLFLLEGPKIVEDFWRNLGARQDNSASVLALKRTVSRMANVISTYVSRQALVALLDGLCVMIIIFAISMIFNFSPSLAIPMGLIAFVLYLIPMFGQIFSTFLISAIIAFTHPPAGLAFLLIYIIYAQIENNFLAPKIQGNALKLPVAVVLSAMVIGIYMLGLIGAIIAIPIAGCIKVLIEEYPQIKTAREN